MGFVRLNANGTIDESFLRGNGIAAPIGTRVSAAVGIEGNKTIIAGQFPQVHGEPVSNLARMNADGSLDNTFNPAVAIRAPVNGIPRSGSVTALALEPNGDLLAAVQINKGGFIVSAIVVRIKPDGTMDPGFATGSHFHRRAIQSKVTMVSPPKRRAIH